MNDIIQMLTAKEDKVACEYAEKIISESRENDKWYEYFDEFASLLDHPNSFVRNRVLYILAANVRWDDKNKFADILPKYLSHITDVKPITARQCVKALSEVGQSKPQLIPDIVKALQKADLSSYRDSMRPLIEKDIRETIEKINS